MRLSIIIPVYNAEEYLKRCLDSIFSQELSWNDYEVIAINDGSKDGSLAILESYQKKYPNLVVQSQENKGEALTRNRALELAKGTYIAFVDSDDSVELNTFKTILERAESEQLDILYLKMDLYDEVGVFIRSYPHLGEDHVILSGFEHPRRTFPATLYLRELTQGVYFDKRIIIGPDSVFNAMVQSKAKRCSYISLPHYKYTHRADSLSKQGHSERAFDGFVQAVTVLSNFEKEQFPNPTASQKAYFDAILCIFLTRIVDYNILPTLNKSRYRLIKKVVSDLDNNHLWKKMAETYPKINQSEFIFFSHCYYLKFKQHIFLFAQHLKKKIVSK